MKSCERVIENAHHGSTCTTMVVVPKVDCATGMSDFGDQLSMSMCGEQGVFVSSKLHD